MHTKQLDIVQVVERRRKWPAEAKRWRRVLRLLALRTGMAFPAAKFMGGSGKRARASCLEYPWLPLRALLSRRLR
jgi:hypothetical protein